MTRYPLSWPAGWRVGRVTGRDGTMYYLALVLVWLSGVGCGMWAAVVLRMYWQAASAVVEADDPHERIAWPAQRWR